MRGSQNSADVHSLEGLREFQAKGIELGVVGWPVRHSLSPPMHAAALAVLTERDPQFSNWFYRAYELRPEELKDAFECFHEKGFRGVNLTVPHKIEVLPLLDEIDPVAERMGAVNTVVFDNGKSHGFNSDGYGLEKAVEESFGRDLRGRDVLILGAGGASRAAAAQCVESGARSLVIANRSLEKAERIAEIVGDGNSSVAAAPIGDAPHRVPAGTLVINATSLGLKKSDPAPVSVQDLPEHCSIFDMIYNPAETALLREGVSRGYPTANGLAMLVHQGVRSLEIWTGQPVDPEPMRSACELVLGAI